MKLEEAMEIVYSLAEENALPVRCDPPLSLGAERQREALNTVHDFMVNALFEGRVNDGLADKKMNKKELGDLVFAIRSELNEHLFVGEDCEAFTMLDELQEEIDKLDIE